MPPTQMRPSIDVDACCRVPPLAAARNALPKVQARAQNLHQARPKAVFPPADAQDTHLHPTVGCAAQAQDKSEALSTLQKYPPLPGGDTNAK